MKRFEPTLVSNIMKRFEPTLASNIMKRFKPSLAIVLMMLAAFLFGTICFLGENFYTLGDLEKSISLGAIITVSFSVIAFIMKLLKETQRHFKYFRFFEYFFVILLFGLVVYFTISPFSHFFRVMANKSTIQQNLQSSISQAEKMFDSYEKYAAKRLSVYDDNLKTAIAQNKGGTSSIDYQAFGFVKDGPSDNTQKAHKLSTAKKLLFPANYSNTSSQKGIKEEATSWLSKAKNTVAEWKPIDVVKVVNEVEKNSKIWLKQLIGFSNEHETGDNYGAFRYSLDIKDVKSDFNKREIPGLVAILCAAFGYLLMILPWIVAKRHTRSYGVSQIANYEIEL